MDPVSWPDNLGHTKILLGVSGGIAAYKAAELCRLFVRAGASVRVMMTRAAQRFVGETTFAALSGNPVATDLFDPQQEDQIGHIQLADEADLLVIAPATANTLAKLNHGVADDLLSTVYLAYSGPVLLAPAMNINMWEHPATRSNVEQLRQRGHQVVGPGSGELACGHHGAGRMAEPHEILEAAGACLTRQDLAGRRLLIAAGPTHEPLDPVRFLGNRSSGRMGVALAAEAASRGAEVTLVAGPIALASPLGVTRVDVTTAAQMAEAVTSRLEGLDVVIMAAAVADYRPRDPSETKIKKEASGESLTLELAQNADILKTLGQHKQRPKVLVGFAAETGGDLDALARKKLKAKGCDLLVANDVSAADAGFEVETNRVVIHSLDAEPDRQPLMSKRGVAGSILDRVAQRLNG